MAWVNHARIAWQEIDRECDKLKILVVTTVHNPDDARISKRQIQSMLDAGHEVTLIAPFKDFATNPPPGVRGINVARSKGPHRVKSLWQVRKLLKEQAPKNDVVLLHDPELLSAMAQTGSTPVVFDVHEDTSASLNLKAWLPDYLNEAAKSVIKQLEKRADEKTTLILAEDSYRPRFTSDATVIPNSTWVPDEFEEPGAQKVVYLGTLTYARGASTLIAAAGMLKKAGVSVEVIGSADERTAAMLRRAQSREDLIWHGFMPNDQALAHLSGALAGLSLLRDEPNYRYSLPTKIVEYMANGVPVVTTPLPVAREIVVSAGAGEVVPFDDPLAATAAILKLKKDAKWRKKCGKNGHSYAMTSLNWANDSVKFLKTLEKAASGW
jgi:glycosyltransferase involved in cell wall biosynthesis